MHSEVDTMATRPSLELSLKKTFSNSAREAAIAARAKRYSEGSSGSPELTPGQRDGQARAAHAKGPLGAAAIKRRASQESLIAPTSPGVKKKPLTTAEAIRKYGFEHPKTIEAAKREDAAKPTGSRKEMYDAAHDRVKREAKAELMNKYGKKLDAMKEASKKAYAAAGHARKNGAANSAQLASAAKAAYQAEKRARKALDEEVKNHPKVKEFVTKAKAYLNAKGR